jgi:hypothetical protein
MLGRKNTISPACVSAALTKQQRKKSKLACARLVRKDTSDGTDFFRDDIPLGKRYKVVLPPIPRKFLMVTTRGSGSWIVERWDEPGFREKK